MISGCDWRLLVNSGCDWRLLVISGCDWRLLVISGCDWRLLVISGCDWRLPVISGCDWRLLMISGCASLTRETEGFLSFAERVVLGFHRFRHISSDSCETLRTYLTAHPPLPSWTCALKCVNVGKWKFRPRGIAFVHFRCLPQESEFPGGRIYSNSTYKNSDISHSCGPLNLSDISEIRYIPEDFYSVRKKFIWYIPLSDISGCPL